MIKTSKITQINKKYLPQAEYQNLDLAWAVYDTHYAFISCVGKDDVIVYNGLCLSSLPDEIINNTKTDFPVLYEILKELAKDDILYVDFETFNTYELKNFKIFDWDEES